jgi:hypothetical protein
MDVHDMCLLSLQAGLRFGEIAGLGWLDVDIIAGQGHLKDAKNNKNRSLPPTDPVKARFAKRKSLFVVGSAASGPSGLAPCILGVVPGIPANSQGFFVATLDWLHVDFPDMTDRSPVCASSLHAIAPSGTQPMNSSFARNFVVVEQKNFPQCLQRRLEPICSP